ncbi:hypothetical protein F7725_002693 [Dissostichus mawsoni]|uniref:Uncharacterized protein n=1 Tax=Dissostichus mawsoni TaxID=36200 RepID=A0A7J5Y321_DISMA|nr:hypothetical protein F7725_002693 [Dissostichus mawsoni]
MQGEPGFRCRVSSSPSTLTVQRADAVPCWFSTVTPGDPGVRGPGDQGVDPDLLALLHTHSGLNPGVQRHTGPVTVWLRPGTRVGVTRSNRSPSFSIFSTMYPVIGQPPSESGAFQVTVMDLQVGPGPHLVDGPDPEEVLAVDIEVFDDGGQHVLARPYGHVGLLGGLAALQGVAEHGGAAIVLGASLIRHEFLVTSLDEMSLQGPGRPGGAESSRTDDLDGDGAGGAAQAVLQRDGVGAGVGPAALQQVQVGAVHLHRHGQPLASLALHLILLPHHLGGGDGSVGDLQLQLLPLHHHHLLRRQVQGGNKRQSCLQSGSLVKTLSETSEGSLTPTVLMARTRITYFFSGLMPSSILKLSSLIGRVLTRSHLSSGRASATSTWYPEIGEPPSLVGGFQVTLMCSRLASGTANSRGGRGRLRTRGAHLKHIQVLYDFLPIRILILSRELGFTMVQKIEKYN